MPWRRDDVPFTIPANVWAVLERNKEKFPIEAVGPLRRGRSIPEFLVPALP
jgi:hypothetical protein